MLMKCFPSSLANASLAVGDNGLMMGADDDDDILKRIFFWTEGAMIDSTYDALDATVVLYLKEERMVGQVFDPML